MRILAIINIFKLKHIPGYLVQNINKWVEQNIPSDWHVDVVLSDVFSFEKTYAPLSNLLTGKSSSNIKFHIIRFKDNYPVYVTFNMCIKYMNSSYGEYDYYIYNSEDCVMTKPNDLKTIINEFSYDPRIAHLSVLVDCDNTNSYPHFNEHNPKFPPLIVPLGESVNMHFSVWNNYFMKQYDFKYMDVLCAYATESVYTFINAAIGTKWAHCRKIVLSHMRSKKIKGYIGYDIFKNFKPLDQIFSYDAAGIGLGFECWMQTRPRKQSAYSPIYRMWNPKAYAKTTGECKNRIRLYEYIKNNLFVPDSVFNYDEEIKKVQFISF